VAACGVACLPVLWSLGVTHQATHGNSSRSSRLSRWGFGLTWAGLRIGIGVSEVVLHTSMAELVHRAGLPQHSPVVGIIEESHQSPWLVTAKGQPEPNAAKLEA
jgi:hypothetical protein